MTAPQLVLDADILSALMRKNPVVNSNAKEAALNAAWDWKFSPTIYQGRPIKVIGQIEFHFHI